MKLFEIIEANEIPGAAINTEVIYRYKRSLLTYYRGAFCCEPILMVTDIFNAGGLGRIVPGNSLREAIDAHLDEWEVPEEDKPHHRETIFFNSIPLSEF